MTAAEFLRAMIAANLVASAAVLLVAVARKPVRRLLGARLAYALWLIPLLAAAATLLPARPLPASRPLAEAAATLDWVVLTPPAGAAAGYSPLLLALWLLGSALSLTVLAVQQRRFTRALEPLTPLAPNLFRAALPGVGPALVGALRPRIIVPADFETRYSEDEQVTILAHERAHLAAGDAQLNALIAAIRAVCWFNPLIHLGAHLARLDQELACDAKVIGDRPAARKPYAAALLKAQLAPSSLPLGCYWPSRSPHPLKERFVMLNRKEPGRLRRLTGAAALAVLGLGTAYAAWAADPAVVPSPPEIVAAATASPAPAVQLAQASPKAPPLTNAAPPPAPPRPTLITQPDWDTRPTVEDMLKAFPEGPPWGNATLRCTVSAEGQVENCVVASESPAGSGVGEGALRLAPLFKMKPQTRDGVPVAGAEINIPVRFAMQ